MSPVRIATDPPAATENLGAPGRGPPDPFCFANCKISKFPAFEAASIKCGVRAASGAIETIKVVDGDLEIGTIENTKAIFLIKR